MNKKYYTMNDMKGYVGISHKKFLNFTLKNDIKKFYFNGYCTVNRKGFEIIMEELGYILRGGCWHKI